MQCPGALRRPLRDIIKSIGANPRHQHHSYADPAKARRPCLRHQQPLHGRRQAFKQYSSADASVQAVAEDESHHLGQGNSTRHANVASIAAAEDDLASLYNPLHDLHGSREPSLLIRKVESPHIVNESFLDPADWQPPASYRRKLDRDAKYKTRKILTRDLCQNERHNYRGVDDWGDIVRQLDAHTPAGAHLYRKNFETVALPQGVSAVFHGNSGAAVLEIMQRTGSHVQIVAKATRVFSRVVLFGTMHQNTMAMQILPEYVLVSSVDDLNASQNLADYVLKREICKDRDVKTQSADYDHLQEDLDLEKRFRSAIESVVDEITTSPVRSTFSVERQTKARPRKLLLQRPQITSTSRLTAYVSDLVSPVPRLMRRRKYFAQKDQETDTDHITQSTKILVGLFTDPSIATIASSEAVDLTLRFLTRHTKFPELRKISDTLESNGYTLTTFNYDVLFAAAAKSADLHNFRYVLKVMLRKGLKPSPITWARFHNLVSRRHPHAAEIVRASMYRKGILANNLALVQVIHDSVESDLKLLIQNDGTISQFLRVCDRRFRKSIGRPEFRWLSRDVMNRTAHLLLKAGRNKDAYTILAEFRRREPHPYVDTTTLNVFLTPAVKTESARLAVAVLQYFHVGLPGAVIPDEITYNMLFLIAYRKRCFNACRVVWRYACAAGHVSHNTEKVVMMSLLRYPPLEATTGNLMRSWTGNFVVGVSDGLHHGKIDDSSKVLSKNLPPESSLEDMSEHEQAMIAMASQTEIPKETPESMARTQALRSILDLDLQEVESSKPTKPLADMLDAALRKDMAWKSMGLGLSRGLEHYGTETMFEYMMRDGVQVPMKAGNFAQVTQSGEMPWKLEKFLRDHGLDGRPKTSTRLRSDDVEDLDEAVFSA